MFNNSNFIKQIFQESRFSKETLWLRLCIQLCFLKWYSRLDWLCIWMTEYSLSWENKQPVLKAIFSHLFFSGRFFSGPCVLWLSLNFVVLILTLFIGWIFEEKAFCHFTWINVSSLVKINHIWLLLRISKSVCGRAILTGKEFILLKYSCLKISIGNVVILQLLCIQLFHKDVDIIWQCLKESLTFCKT